MAHPTWLAYGFALLMLSISIYCIFRLVLANPLRRRNHYDVTVSHVLMGLAMAGMLVPGWNVVAPGLWEAIFAVIALCFFALSVRFVTAHGLMGSDDDHVHHISHYLIHMVMGCAMLYMYWLGMPITTTLRPMSMSGPVTSAGDPGLTFGLMAVLLASAVWQLDSISHFAPRQLVAVQTGAGVASPDDGGEGGDDGRPWLAPRLEIACHIAMCLTMAYMLVLMV